MSKERLKEIDLNKTYNECGITGDLLSIELKPNDYYDLLEQAERVQELEKEIKRLEDFIETIQNVHFVELQREKSENRRYREAIEVAIHNMSGDNLGDKYALGILEQALEVEQ